MKKLLIIAAAVIILIVGYWLASPLLITKKVSEEMPMAGMPEIIIKEVAMGKFAGLAGHNGEGTVKLLKLGEKYYVRFESDFKVTNGPDLFVYFGKDGQYVSAARLGALKGNEGSQNYEIPAGINPEDFNEVWIWCRAFAVPFARAEF